MKAERAKLEATREMTVIELQNALNGGDPEPIDTEAPRPKVVRPAFGSAAAAVRPEDAIDRDAMWDHNIAGIREIYGKED